LHIPLIYEWSGSIGHNKYPRLATL
jgi:hypothetical protein